MRQLVLLALCLLPWLVNAQAITAFSRTVSANGKSFAVTGVKVNLRDPAVRVQVGLAYDHVGRTEELAAIAKRAGAAAAINGSFFDAYTKDALKNPDMSLITGGQLVFKSSIGTVLGFDADNTPHLGRFSMRLGGTVTHNGHALQWFAYWINRRPTATPCVTLFTRHWGDAVPALGGTAVVVDGGTVTAITDDAVAIPRDGFVLHVRGEAKLLARFHVGDTVTFDPTITADDPYGEGAPAFDGVREAVGAGPRVLVHGRPVFTPGREGFGDPKVLSLVGARSAAGYTDDGVLYLITTRGARVSDLGHILLALGCREGLNLDGGASSGLWLRGTYLTRPGRALSNALLIIEKKETVPPGAK
jgi:hypothetical protein